MRSVRCLIMLALLCIPAFADGAHTVVITDEGGSNVTVPLDPETIVCLSPGAAEVLSALGAQERIVTVTDDCSIPQRLMEKESLGESGRSADIERILHLHWITCRRYIRCSIISG